MKTIRNKRLKEFLKDVKETVSYVRKTYHPTWKQLWKYATGRLPLLPQGLLTSRTGHLYENNLIWQTILTKNGMLTSIEPDVWIFVKEAAHQSSEITNKIRGLLRFLWRKGGFQEEIRITDQYARIVGFGIVKIGYELIPNPQVTTQIASQDLAEEFMGLLTAPQTGNPLEPVSEEPPNLLINDQIWEEQPIIRHVSPFRFFYDLDIPIPDLSYANWCCEVLYLTETQLKSLPYRDLDEIQPTVRKDEALIPSPSPSELLTREYYEIWDIYNKEWGIRILYAPSVPEKYIEMEQFDKPPCPGFFPYEMWAIYPIPDSPFPLSETQLLLNPAMTLNYIKTVEINFVQRSLPRLIYRQGTLTEQGVRALESGELLQGLEVQAEEPLGNVIMPFFAGELPQSMLAVEASLREDITTLSGVTDFHRGLPLPTRRLATEIATITQLAGVRGQIEQQRFEFFLSRVLNKFYAFVREFTPTHLPIPTQQGLELVNPRELPEEAHIFIASSGSAADRALERREMIEIIKFLAQANLPPIVWIPFIDRLFTTYNIHPEEAMIVKMGLIQAIQQQIAMQAAEQQAALQQAAAQQPAQAETIPEGGEEGGEEEESGPPTEEAVLGGAG